MGSAKSISQLKLLSDSDLMAEHDLTSNHTVVGLNYYLEEIRHRESAKINKSMKHMTGWITLFTLIMLALTVVNTYLVFVQTN